MTELAWLITGLLLGGCIGITPKEVILDGARKEDIFLQNDCYAVSQVFQRIVADIHTVYQHCPFIRIV